MVEVCASHNLKGLRPKENANNSGQNMVWGNVQLLEGVAHHVDTKTTLRTCAVSLSDEHHRRNPRGDIGQYMKHIKSMTIQTAIIACVQEIVYR